jgi:hypothetical protein
MTPPAYRFRLRLAAKQIGKFDWTTQKHEVEVAPGLSLTLTARNADTLDKATNFHIDAGGFSSEEAATNAAEALRVRLRLLNAVLNLGLNIPVGNKVSASVSEEIKRELLAKQDVVVLDSVWGVMVYPDDGRHLEYVMGGNFSVRPSNTSYVLIALTSLWNMNIKLDAQSEVALHILCLATLEVSEKTAFLTNYLALEQLIDRKPRSDAAKALIETFKEQILKAQAQEVKPMTDDEAKSLSGAIAALTEESFRSALLRFAAKLKNVDDIHGMTPQRFFSTCISARNKIAHNAEPSTEVPLGELAAGLRQVVLSLIWTRNELPSLTINTPASKVEIGEGGFQIRVM